MRALALLLLLAGAAQAAPFLVADVPTPDADTCVYTPHSGPAVELQVIVDAALGKPAFGNRICKVDLAGSPVGANDVRLKLRRKTDTLWGDSPDSPLSFVRPAPVQAPAALRLTP